MQKPILLGLLSLLLQCPVVVSAQNIDQAKITEILDNPQVFIQSKQAKVNDIAKQGEKVRTGETRAELNFSNSGAVVRLSKNSTLSVGSCVRLQRGTVLVNGAINGCTSSIIATVRGTTYVLEAEDDKQQIKVLEGEVVVTAQNNPGPDAPTGTQTKQQKDPDPKKTGANQVTLSAGQQLDVSQDGSLGLINQISQAEFERLLDRTLFGGFSAQLPGIDKIRQSFELLFPGATFPISLPSIPVPSLPSIPGFRLPF
jgi:hypothetical protein